MKTVNFNELLSRIDNETKKEYTLYEDSYINLNTKMNFKHNNCNNYFKMKPKDFLRGQRCPICAQKIRNKKLIKELDKDTKNKIEEKFQFIEYNGISKKNLFKCKKCGYKFHSTIKKILSDLRCPNCYLDKVNKKNKNIDKYQKNLYNLNIEVEIIPDYFYGTVKLSKFKCKLCGEYFLGYYNNFINGKKTTCKCFINNKKNFNYYNELLPKDYIMYENTFKNSSLPVLFKHLKCGNKFEKKPVDFFSNNQHCPYCIKTGKKLDLNYINNILKEKNFTLLESYTNSHDKILIKCNKCGFIEYKYINNIINNDSKCNNCSENISNGEYIIRDFLEEHNLKFEREKKFDGLIYKYNLRFDFYIKKYNTVIEFDGIQHFEPIEFFGGKKYLEEVKIRDSIKDNFCKKNNIKLIRINYTEINNIKNILNNALIL